MRLSDVISKVSNFLSSYFPISRIKNISYFASGGGVAVNMGATELSSTASTTGGLIAAGGYMAVSITKNLRTFSSCQEDLAVIDKLLDKLYRATNENEQHINNALEKLDLTKTQIEKLVSDIEAIRSTYSVDNAKYYAIFNSIFQPVSYIVMLGLHINMARDNNKEMWDWPSGLNLFLVPFCIVVSLISHSYFARKLTSIQNKHREIRKSLEQLKENVHFRCFNLLRNHKEKYNQCKQRINELNATVTEINKKKDSIGKQLLDVENQIGGEGYQEKRKEIIFLDEELAELMKEIIERENSLSKIKEKMVPLSQRLTQESERLRDLVTLLEERNLFEEDSAIAREAGESPGGELCLNI